MDEPLTALDPPRKAELMDYIARIPEVWSIPILYVTHSPEELIRLARHLLVLRARGPWRPSGRWTKCWPTRAVAA